MSSPTLSQRFVALSAFIALGGLFLFALAKFFKGLRRMLSMLPKPHPRPHRKTK